MKLGHHVLLFFVLVVIGACAADDSAPDLPPPEQVESDRRHACEVKALCALEEGNDEFSVDECVREFESLSDFSDECAERYAARNACLAVLSTCADYREALGPDPHECKTLDLEAMITFCGPVAEPTDGEG